MKTGFYTKLAWNGIRKNKRLYIPYILSGVVMVMMSYIIFFLSSTEVLEHMKGGGTLRVLLPVGSVVVCVFSFIFMFYSNSFLIRQRYKEFGLYHILGMDKYSLGLVMVWENFIVATICILGGLILGTTLSKLAELAILNLMKEEITYIIRVDFLSAIKTLLIFVGVYLILLLNSILKVRRSNALELFRSSNVGEVAPRANWVFATIGVILLATAYYIVLSIKQPLSAILWFMVAVVLVIIATYLLFMSGSVALCKILQNKKSYYYKANHFISVSSMAYRMKRNGAGLAAICILITMVLVMLASTLSLYIGVEDALETRYPYDISVSMQLPSVEFFNEASISQMRNGISNRISERENILEYSCAQVTGLFTTDGIIADPKEHSEFNLSTYESVGYLSIISLDDYNRVMGANETLEKDECFLYCYRTQYSGNIFTIEGIDSLKVKSVLQNIFPSGYEAMQIVPSIILITSNFDNLIEHLLTFEDSHGYSFLNLKWCYSFDMNVDIEAQITAYNLLKSEMDNISIKSKNGSYTYGLDGKEAARKEFLGLYAGLFFVGIFLGGIFLFATVLIIYYKQISEGYEDQKRFNIMQKVGLTKNEIRKTINSQVFTVFFLPLILAGIHLGIALPILWILLQLLNLSNLNLMLVVAVVSYFIMGIIYTIVYKVTSNSYYSIVSGTK